MNYSDLQFLYSLGNFGIRPGLTNIEAALKKLGSPENHPRIIHVAGTNGKGSTIAYLERMLLDKGYKVATTTSPHLERLNERFRFQGEDINDDELGTILYSVLDACGMSAATQPEEWEIRLTFFEIMIAAAFVWFRRLNPDYILLEVGMGGRLDATNIAKTMLQVITPISIDHAEYLGDTLELIAAEKAGIIKRGGQVIVSQQQESARNVIAKQCQEVGAEASFYGTDFNNKDILAFLDTLAPNDSTSFGQPLAASGSHQAVNAATAIEAFKAICRMNADKFNFAEAAHSVMKASCKGRTQLLNVNPPVMCDGAHNEEGMRALLTYLADKFPEKRILMGINFMREKHLTAAFRDFPNLKLTLRPLRMDFTRSTPVEECQTALRQADLNVLPPCSIPELVAEIWGPENVYDLTVVCGSIYLLGEFYDAIGKWKAAPGISLGHFDNIAGLRI